MDATICGSEALRIDSQAGLDPDSWLMA